MAYVPPHKRHSTAAKGQTLTPDLLVAKFKKNLDLKSSKSSDNADKFTYANNAIHRWIPIGLGEDEQIPSSIQLQSFPVEAIEQKVGVETLQLVNCALDREVSQARGELWLSIVENVLQDLLASFEAVRNEMKDQTMKEVKPALVVRIGKILFRDRNRSRFAEPVEYSPTEDSLRDMRKVFYTNVPESYIDHIKSEVVPEIGVEFLHEKDIYHVQLSDTSRPDTIISCKCGVAKGASRLELYKLEINQLRHMIVDVSCLDKSLDLRLMLRSKRILTFLTKGERKSIINLVRSAVLDHNVNGGLRWPSNKESSGARFRVVGVWHTISKTFGNSSIRLKLRHADRINFRTSIGEATKEVVVKLKGVASALLEQKLEISSISNMLEGEMKLIMEHFLHN